MRIRLDPTLSPSHNLLGVIIGTVSLLVLFTGLSLVTAERAAAACTLDEIDACIKDDPAAAEKLLRTTAG